jgi:hypothetical protein
MRSGRKSKALRGGGILSRFDAFNESVLKGGGSVPETLRVEVPFEEVLYSAGKSI